jgi:hypothetical protein
LTVIRADPLSPPPPGQSHQVGDQGSRGVQCSAVQCSAVQCSAVGDRGSRGTNSSLPPSRPAGAPAVQCSAVQCSAVQCSAVAPASLVHPALTVSYSFGLPCWH